MLKKYIMSPGPTEVPPSVLLRTAEPIIHHRTSEFEKVLASVSEGLKEIFKTSNSVLTFASSGTGAMQGAVSSFLSPGDKAVCIRGGKFGERWGEICKAFGVEVIAIDVPWGESVDPASVQKALKENPDVKAVYATHCETSTGTLHDIQALGDIVSKTPAILVVDAVSSMGSERCMTDEWGLDIVVTGSQKALMLPPGLAFASVSDKAWELTKTAKCPEYYFSYTKARKSLEKGTTAYTPAVSLIMGLDEALKIINKEGIEAVWTRTEEMGKAMRAGMIRMGLEIFSKRPASALTSVIVPEGVNGDALPKKVRVEYGVTIAGGQDSLKGKIFRVSTMGYADLMDVPMALTVIGMALKELGFDAEIGRAVDAAAKVLYEYKVRRSGE